MKGNKSALFYFSTNSLQSQPLRSSLVPAFGLENEKEMMVTSQFSL